MYRRRWAVIVAWVLAVVALFGLGLSVGGAYDDEFRLPDSESATAFDLLETRFPAQAGDTFQVVMKARTGSFAERGEARDDVRQVLAAIRAVDVVTAVEGPLGPGGDARISPDGSIAYADVTLAGRYPEIERPVIREAVDAALSAETDVVQVEAGGQTAAFATASPDDPSTMVAIAAATVVLAVTFGTLVATAVPILSAVFALLAGLGTITLLSHLFPVAEFTPIIASLIGLGVGIDYALFLVSRFRHELHRGATVEDSVVTAVNTSGRAVSFAGITVIVALLGLLAMRTNFFTGVAVSTAAVVGFTVVSALTLLPAFMGVLGHGIDRVRLRPQREHDEGRGRWDTWARTVERRPVTTLLVGLAITTVLALPLLGMRLSFSNLGSSTEGTTARQAYDLLAEGFGPGFNGPFLITATLDQPDDAAELDGLVGALANAEGVLLAAPPVVNDVQDAALITVVPASGPQEVETSELLTTLRDDVIPPAVDGTGVTPYVGGSTALSEDFSRDLAGKTPMFIAIVVALSLLLLLAVFRSVVIPLKAAAMNLVSVTAAFGVLVAVFQWGWGTQLLGVEPGPIEPFVPAMMFAILFGLSMDYEVFLVSRMHEEWVQGRDNSRAVRRGLSLTGGIVTAAALIMIAVFLAFLPSPDRLVKVFGLGLGAAIFIDAFIIRSLLVPSAMYLFGRWNWYLPAWLERWVPHVSLEGGPAEPVDPEATEPRPPVPV
jgi:RND superfamily putative drug exporter